MTCGMCGRTFTAADSAASCARCSLFGAGGCHKVRCPHCGYEMPPPSRLGGLLSRVFGRQGRRHRHRHAGHPHGLVPLSCLHSGEHGVIASIGASDTSAVRKLMALGVLPGAAVSIIQTFPSHVLQIGQTQLAVDTALADTITVRVSE